MLRGLFTNRLARNHLADDLPPAWTVLGDGARLPVHLAADRLADAGQAVVLLAGERYGMGSSRDWAAKGVALLGARAVIARSFERIHRQNLIGMGVLPIQIADAFIPAQAGLLPTDRLMVDVAPDHLVPRMAITVEIQRQNGTRHQISCKADVQTIAEVDTLRQGGVLSALLRRSLAT